MGRDAMRLTRAVIVATVVSLLAGILSLTGLSSPAAAAEPGVAPVQSMLDQIGQWSQTLAQVGKLADALPAFGSTPGSVLGTPDLVKKAIVDQFLAASVWSDLAVDKDVTI